MLQMLRALSFVVLIPFLLAAALPAGAQVTAYRLSVAEHAARDAAIAEFYRARTYAPIWTGPGEADRARRAALVQAFARAGDHGLPEGIYDPENIIALLAGADTPTERGTVEVELTRLFLAYATSLGQGILNPRSFEGIERAAPEVDRLEILSDFVLAEPSDFLSGLAPSSPEYTRLMREKVLMENLIAAGGWGPTVPFTGKMEPGDTGASVVALRDRLVAMGYLQRGLAADYDAALTEAVRLFQRDHGLLQDGIVGEGTLAEINTSPERRLQSILVALERERWTNFERGDRHIWVNLTDFTARIVDFDEVTFETISVVGARNPDRQSPEFSDEMEHMVLNPTWFVPQSIATRDYLPELQADPFAASYMVITDVTGQVVDRSTVDFSQYSSSNFPFDMRQPPSNSNALGLVKFMFPNRHNIYLHDTPARSLFQREVRAFSSGCIRLNQPREFAYALLTRQSANPEQLFNSILQTGQETQLDLDVHVPVHIVYRTAFTDARGTLNFRRDVYGRDGRIWDALVREGLELNIVRG